jgi:hypothetical protein
MDVRCCCNPGKLIGTVPDYPVLTGVETHIMATARGVNVDLPGKDGGVVPVEVSFCRLIENGEKRGMVAIKSNDLPLEYYEKIQGFESSKEKAKDPVKALIDDIFG